MNPQEEKMLGRIAGYTESVYDNEVCVASHVDLKKLASVLVEMEEKIDVLLSGKELPSKERIFELASQDPYLTALDDVQDEFTMMFGNNTRISDGIIGKLRKKHKE